MSTDVGREGAACWPSESEAQAEGDRQPSSWQPSALATPFVGRHPELATLSRMMTDSEPRLVTILGPGGVGKSRLLL